MGSEGRRDGVLLGVVALHLGLSNLRTGPDLRGVLWGRVRGRGIKEKGPWGQEKSRK